MNNVYNTIEELLNAPESEYFEFKEAKRDFDFNKAVAYCCAISNCGGGKLILGVTDKRPRKVVGSHAFLQPEVTVKRLINKLHIRVMFQIYNENTPDRVLVFDVAGRPLGLPVLADSIAWWRRGEELVVMPESVRRDIYAEAGYDYSSAICPGATLLDLDGNAIENFREKWLEKSGNKRIKNLSVKQLLHDCEAINDDGVTYAALVLFGTRTALGKFLALSEIVFEYRSTEKSGPADARENFRVGFFTCYDKVWDLINLRNTKQSFQEGLFVFDILTFNERVIREALLNAVAHRNYQIEGSVFVKQYPDRLVIDSPGGFPSGITVDNILDRQKPRNRRIAEILALCGLVERAGQGMNLIYEFSIKEAKSLPDFTGTDDYLVRITLNGLVLDSRLLTFLNRIGNERLEILYIDDFLIIDTLFREKPLPENLRRRIKRLVDMGIVEHTGRNKFILARGLYEAAGKSGVHTRLTGLDRNYNKGLILEHIRKSGTVGAPLKEIQQVLPSHNRGQLQVLLRELKADGFIYPVGKTSSARWFAVSDYKKNNMP